MTYEYDDTAWGDLLTAYDGQTITYDAIGNPLSYRGMTMAWTDTRRLATVTEGAYTYQYEYDSDGLRVERALGGGTYRYHYNGGALVRIEYEASNLFEYLDFITDGQSLVGFRYCCPDLGYDAIFYYLFGQGNNVEAIVDAYGTVLVSYVYDAWGNFTATVTYEYYTLPLYARAVSLSPLRYRSYVYDYETGFYYLQSRYYDPEVGRFISADTYVSTGQGFVGNNMFAYCLNDPVNKIDYNGNKPGDLFNTMDEAARDAAIYLGALSFKNGWEYITVIYSVNAIETSYKSVTRTYRFLWWSWTKTTTKAIQTRVKKYTYKAVKTNKDSDSVNIPRAPLFRKRLATVHTHPMGSGIGITEFSDEDKETANRLGLVDYVYGPNGEMRKYDPSTGEDILLFSDLPVSPNRPWLN